MSRAIRVPADPVRRRARRAARPRHAGRQAALKALPALVTIALVGCSTRSAEPEADPVRDPPRAAAATDTLRGTVVIVGADPLTHVALRVDGGQVPLDGPASSELRRAGGLELLVEGTREHDRFRVTEFRVRSAHGLPAADGILALEGEDAILTTPGGDRLRYRPAPAALREHAGARVWIAGEPGGEPQAWGILAPAG
ncbi:MAG: hypothetical protein ACLFRX_10030 [Gemmatimonadota bacterium]